MVIYGCGKFYVNNILYNIMNKVSSKEWKIKI